MEWGGGGGSGEGERVEDIEDFKIYIYIRVK